MSALGTTHHLDRQITSYRGEGKLTVDALETFGAFGSMQVPDSRFLRQDICRNTMNHRLAAKRARETAAIEVTLRHSPRWDIYHHR